VSSRDGQRLYCQHGLGKDPVRGSTFVNAQEISGQSAFTPRSHPLDSDAKPSKINYLAIDLNEFGLALSAPPHGCRLVAAESLCDHHMQW
jgi:hypothetical protein